MGASVLPRLGWGGWGQREQWQGCANRLQPEPSLVPVEAGAASRGERLHNGDPALCTWCFTSVAVWASSASIPGCGAPHSPQAVSSQPTAVPSPGLLSKPHVLAPSPRVHLQAPVSGWGAQGGCGTDHLHRSHCVLPATDQLPGSPLSLQVSPSVPGDLPAHEEASPVVATSPHLHLPARSTGPILLPLLFLFPSSFFHATRLHGDLSCPFRCPRSSASVQQVLCENCSTCRCIPSAFVGRGELHVLLLLCHLGKSLSPL